MSAYFKALRNYAVFSGRATRAEFWWFMLILMLLLILGLVLDESMGFSLDGPAQPITGLIWLAHALPAFGIQTRRLHDIGKSGWWQLICIIPFGAIVLLIFYVTASDEGANVYGPSQAGKNTPKFGSMGSGGAWAPEVILEQLEKLSKLKASGVIDEAEFTKMKSELIDRKA